MGGNVAVTVREEDGTEHRMDRWTNSLSYFLQDLRLIRKDAAHLKLYLDTWYELVEDWERNKDTKEFQYDMTPVYASSSHLVPSEYGLVIVDFKSNLIWSNQHYCSIREMHGSNLMSEFFLLEQHSLSSLPTPAEDPKEDPCLKLRAFLEFIKDGKLLRTQRYDRQADSLVDISNPTSFEELKKWFDNHHLLEMVFTLDFSPFAVVEHNDDNWEEHLKTIRNMGFVLSAEEEKLWEECINAKEED